MISYQSWFNQFCQTKHYSFLKKQPLAYFSIEFALSDKLPTYAGGLGVLAGDYVKELYDQKMPAVAVGMYYQSKYGEKVSADTEQTSYPSPHEQGLLPVVDASNKPIVIQVPLADHDVSVKAWIWQHNSIPVYLLDTNVETNSPDDRVIGYKLYDSNKQSRLKQEIILGVGGYRLLEALHIEPSIFHMNEGHSSMLALEIIRHEMKKRHISFAEGLKLSLHHLVFTNHTLVPGGNEIFAQDLVHMLLGRFASILEVPVTEITALGLISESNMFSMTLFALKVAGKINGVSKLHASLAAKAWPDYPVEAVTNGIHLPSWDSIKHPLPSKKSSPRLLGEGQAFGSEEQQSTAQTRRGEVLNKLEQDTFWQTHQKNKKQLLNYIKTQINLSWNENHLLVGWARRVVRYKRPLAIFEDIDRLVAFTTDKKRPIRIVVSGITHHADGEGHEMILAIQEIIQKKLPQAAVYLPNYSVQLARLLTTGCDVWLNTPVVGSEACGTSGMKASLNGVLPLTTKDGWIDEVDLTDCGWLLNSEHVSNSIYESFEKEIVPSYYATDKSLWQNTMQHSRQLIQNHFSTTRMLKEYLEKMYLPIITSSYSHYLS